MKHKFLLLLAFCCLTICNKVFGDVIVPNLVSTSPTHNSINFPVASNLTITYDQNVTAVTGKNITITPINPTGTAIVIPADNAQITIVGAVVTINPTANLLANTVYEVTVEAGAFVNGADASLAIGVNTWRFYTGANNMVTTASLSNLCVGNTAYTILPNFSIQEIFSNDFPTGTSRTIILNAPTNFEFEAGTGTLTTTGADLSGASIFVTNTQIIAFYDVNALVTFDKLEFSGIKIKATNTVSIGNIIRNSGTGIFGQTDHILAPNFTVASLTSVAPPSAPSVAGSPFNYCLGDDMSLKNVTATGGTTYRWFSDAGLTTQVATGATVTAASLGVSSLTLNTKDIWVLNDNGTCRSSALKITFIINDNPIVFLSTSVPTDKICEGQTIVFTGSGTSGIEYSFKLDRTLPTASNIATTAFSATTTYTTSNLLTAGTYTMVITGRNPTTLCQTSSTTNTFNVFANPSVIFTLPIPSSFSPSQSTPVNLAPQATPAGGIFSGPGISGTNFIPSIAGTGTHTILYTFTNANGCSDTKTIILNVSSGGFIVPVFFCEGDVPATVLYGGPGNLGGSCDIDPNPGQTYSYGFGSGVFSFTGPSAFFNPDIPPINALLTTNEFVAVDGAVKPFCNSYSFYFQSYVLRKPNPTITGNNSVCAGQTNVKYSVTAVTSGVSNHTYNWVVTGGTIVGSATNNEVFVNWGTAGTGTIQITQTANYPTLGAGANCAKTQTQNITINALPNPTITGAISVCEHPTNTTVYSVTTPQANHTYAWNVSGAGGIITTTTATSATVRWTTAGIGIISLQDTDNIITCSNTINQTITVNPLPTATITGNANVCVGATGVNYNIPINAGRTYLWSLPSGGGTITSGGSTNNVNIDWTTSGARVVQLVETINATGCQNTYTKNVLVNVLPVADIVGSNTACANSTGNNYTSSGNTPAFSYVWAITNGTITSGAGTPNIVVSWNNTATGTLTLIKTDNSTTCVSTLNTFNVTINPLPTPTVTGSANVCANQTNVIYSTTNNVGFSYNWVVTGGFVSAGQGTNQVNVDWGSAGTGTVIVTETSDKGCSTTTTAYNVTKNPLPNPTITGATNVCENKVGEIYSVPNNAGSTYVWTVTGGTITAGQTTNTITITWGLNGVGSVSVKETTGSGCTQVNPNSISIIKFSTPSPIVSGNNDVCENIIGEVYATQNNIGNTYSWAITGGFITAGANTSQVTVTWGTAGIGTLTVTETNPINCTKTTNAFNVTKNPFPNPIITGDNTVCENSAGNVYQVPVVTGHLYSWAITGGFIIAGQSTNQITVTWDTAGLGTIILTQTSNKNCTKASATFNVTKRARPVPIIIGNNAVCELSTTTYNVTANANRTYNWTVVGGTIASGQGTNSINVTWLTSNNNPASVSLMETINYSASAPFTAISCQTSTQAVFNVTISPLPLPDILGDNQICAGINIKNDATTTTYKYSYSAPLIPNMSYVWSVPTNNGTITNGVTPNQIFVEWSNSTNVGQLKLVQTSTISPFCQGEITKNITINPTPFTDYSIANVCLGDNTVFTPAVINNGWSYEWRFSDGTSIANSQIGVKQFSQIGNQTVKLITKNIATGCVTEFEKTLRIYAVPQSAFTYRGSCQAGGNSQTQFTDNSTITTGYTITQWTWDFGDGTPIFVTTNPATKSPQHSYALPGEYIVTLTTRGDVFASCAKSISQKINIFPKYVVTPVIPYYENFDNGQGDWIASNDIGNTKNWKHGTSAPDRNIKPKYPNDKYWVIGIDSTYRNNLRTYIETPCFEIAQLTKPILTMKTWSDTDQGADGTALFVTYNDGADWKVVGDTSQGLNWYNARNILAIPGSNISTDNDSKRVGWTGKSNGWRNTSFALDEVKQTAGTGTIRFRFAFSSNSDNPVNNWDGFAIDSVFIGERNRRVLIENFTATENIPISEYTATENIANVITNETVLLQYFPSFSTDSKLSKDNTADPGARALLYGISTLPRSTVDGKTRTQVLPSTWTNNEFLRRTLIPSPFEIDVTFPNLPADKLNIKATLKTEIITNRPLIIHAVIVEETISASNSGAPVQLRNVVKRMLPSAAGTYIPKRVRNVGDSEDFNISWSLFNVNEPNAVNPRIYDWSKVSVVVFIQDDETNEIYQSVFKKPTVLPTIISAVENSVQNNNQPIIAPNPAIDEVFIGFEEKTLNDYSFEIVDNFGKIVYKNAWTGEEKGARFSVKTLAKGIYIVRIYDTRKNIIATKKMIIQ